LEDCRGAGIVVDKSWNVTIDFDGHTYTVGSSVGSAGTESQAMQLLKRSTVVLKNGTLVADSPSIKIMINDYAGPNSGVNTGSLTLDNMVLDATKGNNGIGGVQSVLKSINGPTYIQNGTKIIAKEGDSALDVQYWPKFDGGSSAYPDGVHVKIMDNTVVLSGAVKYSNNSDESQEVFLTKAILEVPSNNMTIAAPEGYQWSTPVEGYKKLVPTTAN